MTPVAMEFINADTNAVDPALTAEFTQALRDGGFVPGPIGPWPIHYPEAS